MHNYTTGQCRIRTDVFCSTIVSREASEARLWRPGIASAVHVTLCASSESSFLADFYTVDHFLKYPGYWLDQLEHSPPLRLSNIR